MSTYGDHANIHDVAGRILTILLDEGIVTGQTVNGRWLPASVVLAQKLFPDQLIVTRSHAREEGPAYTRYYQTMAALALLHREGIVDLGVEASGEIWRVMLA